MDEMECRLQALETFQARLEAADVFRRLDALEKTPTPGDSCFDADSIVCRLARLEKAKAKALKPDNNKKEIERRLEALVELTATGPQEPEADRSTISVESDQLHDTLTSAHDDEDSFACLEAKSDESENSLRGGAGVDQCRQQQQGLDAVVEQQEMILAMHEKSMNKLLVRLESSELAQHDSARLSHKAVDLVQEVKTAVDSLSDCYVLLGSDVTKLTLDINQQRQQLQSGLSKVMKQVKWEMSQHHRATIVYVQRNFDLLYERGHVVSEQQSTETEIKDTHAELESAKRKLARIRSDDQSQKATAARADLSSRKAELERYISHLFQQQESLKKTLVFLANSAKELRGLVEPSL